VLAGSNGYGAEEILARIEKESGARTATVTGYVSRPTCGWYARRDFRLPSLDEGFGAGLGAMAAGVPVITSNTLPARSGGGRNAAVVTDREPSFGAP
jgi:glycosyltransferase involved in cell wall biosynthesis